MPGPRAAKSGSQLSVGEASPARTVRGHGKSVGLVLANPAQIMLIQPHDEPVLIK